MAGVVDELDLIPADWDAVFNWIERPRAKPPQ
jgi:hypothetical protein